MGLNSTQLHWLFAITKTVNNSNSNIKLTKPEFWYWLVYWNLCSRILSIANVLYIIEHQTWFVKEGVHHMKVRLALSMS